MSTPDRRGMLDRADKALSIRRQCMLLGIARSGVYRPPSVAPDRETQMPFYFAEKQLLAVLRRKHDVVLALPGRVIKMIELCFHHGLLEGSWRFPKETS